MRTHYCGQINEQHIDQTITVCGWAHRRRDHGGVIFIDIRDREGLLQVVYNPDIPVVFANAERVRSEYVLKVVGKVRRRPAGTGTVPLTSCIAVKPERRHCRIGRSAPSQFAAFFYERADHV